MSMSYRRITLLSLALLFVSVNCSISNAKWNWINTALDRSKIAKEVVDVSELTHPSFDDHPYYNADFQRQLDRVSASYLTAGNQIKILADRASTDTKLEMVKAAKKSIYIATFQIICDEGGMQFLDALTSAAGRGIDVRILIDGGIWSIYGGNCPEKYTSKGLKVIRSNNSIFGSADDLQLHDKLFIVDAEAAITGGQNIGSFWADSSGEDENFRDTDIWVKGPVVTQIAMRFVQLWRTSQPTNPDLKEYEALLGARSQNYREKGLLGINQYPSWLAKKELNGLCRFVAQDPQLGNHNVFKIYTALAQAAKRRIVFHVPSLNGLGSPEQEGLLAALVDGAHEKSVQVDIITNGPGFLHSRMLNGTLGWFYGVFTLNRLYNNTENTSMNVYVYKYWLHSKVFAFDGLAVAVGSFNFDETGLDWTESTLICMDNELSKSAGALLARDFSNSRLLSKTVSPIHTAQR